MLGGCGMRRTMTSITRRRCWRSYASFSVAGAQARYFSRSSRAFLTENTSRTKPAKLLVIFISHTGAKLKINDRPR
jgi:hypothetical protein